jgi:BirA family biotin operon repressor/biotin-[acetyl-CoA-carboxylase] ligase
MAGGEQAKVDDLSLQRIKKGLRTQFVGQSVVYYPSVGSTNEVAKALAAQRAPQGTLVIAEEQTAGKGRLGRRWLAPAGSSLLFSLLFYPDLAPRQVMRLTMLCALATIEGIRAVTGLIALLKWPNDILLRDKKAGGILTEAGMTGERLDYAIVGLGLNVNLALSQMGELAATATSLSEALGREVPRVPLLQAILEGIEERYHRLQAGWSPREEWAAHLVTLGLEVRVATPWGVEEGLAEAVDEAGALLLRQDDGSLAYIPTGDVTLRVR